jgi:putative NADH-flavin reductase
VKLVILGATGGVGKQIVRRANERGHKVTALVRAPNALKEFGSRINVIQGDLLDASLLAEALQDQDAVLSGFGPRLPVASTDSDLLRRFAISLTAAMQQAATRRVIVVSTAFLFKDAILPPAHLVGRLFFRGIVEDSAVMEEILQKSNLDWTLVRPPQLSDQPATGRYRVRQGHLPFLGFKISRADTADFMVKTAEDNSYIRRIVGVSN